MTILSFFLISYFGMNVAEFLSFIGLILGLLAGVIYIRTKLMELEVRLIDLEGRMKKDEQEIDKINDKLENKIDKIDEKIDNIISVVNEIKVNCATNCKFENN